VVPEIDQRAFAAVHAGGAFVLDVRDRASAAGPRPACCVSPGATSSPWPVAPAAGWVRGARSSAGRTPTTPRP